MINFPMGMAINRMITKDDTNEFHEKWASELDVYFGSPAWQALAYTIGTDLLGTRKVKIAGSQKRLLEWYCNRLESAFGFVSTPQPILKHEGHLHLLLDLGWPA
jgi:hypothetical protein